MIPLPQMIYHVVEAPKEVRTEEDLKYHLDRGWAMSPQSFDEIKMLRAKIAYHQAEAERLADILIEKEDALPQAEAEPEKKKPGRPKVKS